MIFCSVNGCFSNDKFGSSQVFYRIPKKPIDRLKLWQQFCDDPNVTKGSSKRKHVCDLHFLASDFIFMDGNKCLKGNAVPSVNILKDGSLQTNSNILKKIKSPVGLVKCCYRPIGPVSAKKDFKVRMQSLPCSCNDKAKTKEIVDDLDRTQEPIICEPEISCETIEVEDSQSSEEVHEFTLDDSGQLEKEQRLLGIPFSSVDQNIIQWSLPTNSDSQIGDVGDKEWHKLYNPSSLTFPQLAETYIGPMINQMRAKLGSLSQRDQFEVRFLLSLFSCYPQAPPHIKKLMLQRLNLVYIATMFKWDTAIALIPKAEIRDISATKHVLAAKRKSQGSSPGSVRANVQEQNIRVNPESLHKLPEFPFEIIVKDKGSKD